MLIRRKKPWDLPDSEITPERIYLNRRRLIAAAGAAFGTALMPKVFAAESETDTFDVREGYTVNALINRRWRDPNDKSTNPFAVFSYNNFAEFGPEKEDPSTTSLTFQPRPWTITIDGLCKKPVTLDLDDFLKPNTFEYRTTRLRCTETWSIVVPWVGIPLDAVIKRAEPLGNAKFVKFTSVLRPDEMPGQQTDALAWPYIEALRLDEALNPLSFLAVGMYGQPLRNQNGAPIRLVVPWKYGFKSAKSIVRISFVEAQPQTSWNLRIPHEYGFWANVNPNVDHARWSQATERRLGEFRRRPTLMFNGYADDVASLYSGMDLVKNF
jgi:sulfoxide reductase catalytic subunit YedY